ncbi:unnamed protein product [Psylliodes chrysocephalus]|uniref:Nose resistant-to-fluoxetine protein N-terminal domain-containing protein n=1 Tax=Psylliodes chrysocephalus TaxID=3402493 RepID=A0A9P0CK60_9CUCU|nr:unnamed protein product [Psylliodes chrysocephala]
MQELKQYRIWATQMFDATTKFPTGFLEGSSYDFGNFDECIDSGNRYFTGKYCLVKFTLQPPIAVKDFEISNGYSNYTIWNKIADYLQDPSKSPRNDLRFAFCMPSSCSHSDLHETLLEVLDKFNEESSFKVTVDIDELRCQVSQTFGLDIGDGLFLLVIAIAVINVIIGSLYDFVTNKEAFRHYKHTGRINDIILCFSLQKNIKKLTTVSKNADSLNCMAGMKVYSMCMIIMLHRNMFDFGAAIENPKYVEKLYSEFGATFLLNGPILVDTFFTISGFLASYLALYYYHNSKGKYNILQLYIHRYVRLTSTYWIIIMFYCTLFVKLGNGPLWRERIEFEQQKCKEVWWANLLYINNYYDTKNYCMFQSWYMACDTNAFMLVPLIGLLLYKKPVAGLISVLLLIGASMIAVFATVYVYDEMPILLTYMRMVLHPNEDSTFLRIYIPGHLRAGAYFLGVLTGYIKYRMNLNNWKMSIQFVKICWITSVILLFVSLHFGFVFYVLKVPTWISALYASLHRLGWSIGIAWILVATSSGYGSNKTTSSEKNDKMESTELPTVG